MAVFSQNPSGEYGVIVSQNRFDFEAIFEKIEKEGWREIERVKVPENVLNSPPFSILNVSPTPRYIAFVQKIRKSNGSKPKVEKEYVSCTVTQSSGESFGKFLEKILEVAEGIKEKFGYEWYFIVCISGSKSKYKIDSTAFIPDCNLRSFVDDKQKKGYRQVGRGEILKLLSMLPNLQAFHRAPYIKSVIYLWIFEDIK